MIKLFDTLKVLHVKNHSEVSQQLISQDFHTMRHFLSNRQIGGTIKKIVKHEKMEFTFYITKTDNGDGYKITIHKDDNENDIECLLILANPKTQLAYISYITYFSECAKVKLNYPGGGTILLELAVKFLKTNVKTLNINRIILTDLSKKWCAAVSDDIDLSVLYMLTKGNTWYGKHGFKPYNCNQAKQDDAILELYKENQNIVKKTKLKNTRVYEILKQTIKEKKMFSIDTLKKLYDLYKEKYIIDFFLEFLNQDKYDSCAIFYYSYKKISMDIKLNNLFGVSYYYNL